MGQNLTLYLCEDSVASESDVLSTKAKERVDNGKASWKAAAIEGFEKATLLIIPSYKTDPKWVGFLNMSFPEVESLDNMSSGSILFLERAGKKFVIPFGTGYFSINENVLVNDFGLMITANEVLEDSLRFMDSNNPSAGTKSRVQADRLSGISGFDLDSALAFIKKLGGVAETGSLGKTLSGSTGLRFTGPEDVSLLGPFLQTAVTQYSADTYKSRGLEIIGAMKPVVERGLIDVLDMKLLSHVKANDGEFVLTSPAILDWDVVGTFRFGGWRDRTDYPDLSLTDCVMALEDIEYEHWGSETAFLSDLKSVHTVSVNNADSGEQIRKWNLYRCLQGSVEHSGNRYTLSEGKWFFVADNFRIAVINTFEACRANVNDAEFPLAKLVTKTIVKNNKNVESVGVESEGEYNESAAAALGLMYLDKETGAVAGVANQRNELCDMLSLDSKRLVHVKKGSRASGSLHHLFRQGATAARMLRDPNFLSSIGAKLRNSGRNEDAIGVESLGKGEHTIEFRIIDRPRENGDFDIPFFAKVALHYAAKEIAACGCNVTLGFINQGL
ncbi:hypothetical protein FJ492_20475 [Mesorhizobium sp. B2-5-4]|uniref:DUF6119 family protein n=1 Tax=Mesorhizobium sp. B2-5-4 TaxID=2589926 RepID=UPI0011281974|nr:DUF6119 family protein [Mesorhizobium sp. B2-5-4]TPK41370.1 hypothetical protein FJ492_20475 [Mesorhizobium sp. B2-5-4]